MLETTRKKILDENEQVKTFIIKWRTENKALEISEHNAKFRIDFNKFLDQSNFCESTKRLFKS